MHNQQNDTIPKKVSSRYIDDIDKQVNTIDNKIRQKTANLLKHFRHQEENIIKKLNVTDSTKAKQMAIEARERYANLLKQD